MADYPASFKAVSGKQNITRGLDLVYIWKKPCIDATFKFTKL